MGFTSTDTNTKKDATMYGTTTNRNMIPRHEQHDLGLTPREEVRCASDFSTSLRALLVGKPAPRNLFTEVGDDLRRRATWARPRRMC